MLNKKAHKVNVWSCRDCGRGWTSLIEAHCTGCCEHFSTVLVSDHHQRRGVCRPPAEVVRKDGSPRYRLDETGRWGPIWRDADRRPDGNLAESARPDAQEPRSSVGGPTVVGSALAPVLGAPAVSAPDSPDAPRRPYDDRRHAETMSGRVRWP